MITVFLSKALICFAGTCHPALVGPATPTGDFTTVRRYVLAEGYGGDVLQYAEDEKNVFAIHRVYTRNNNQWRIKRLRSENPADRTSVTEGCINVSPEVYDALIECCAGQQLSIHP